MINLYRLDKAQSIPLTLPDMLSLDIITRQLPDGYYSTFRTYGGCTRVLGLSAHLRRLPNVDASSLRRNLIQLLEHFHRGEARVRIMMTFDGQIHIAIEPLKPLPREVYEHGVRVETTALWRNSPRLKSTAFIGASETERKHISQLGIFEALLTRNGRILEGMTSNFFYSIRPERSGTQSKGASTSFVAQSAPHSARREAIFTARRDILIGVTRRTVIHVARGRGVKVMYQPLKLSQLPAVDEAFITSSSRGIVPVIQIDDVRVGEGAPGRITQMLMSTYDEYVLSHAEKI